MYDAGNVLQESVDITATTNSTGIKIGLGAPVRKPLYAHVIYQGALNSSGSNTLTFRISHSKDNSTWNVLSTAIPINLTTVAKDGLIEIPVVDSDPYIRLEAVIAGGGSGSAATYKAYLTNSKR